MVRADTGSEKPVFEISINIYSGPSLRYIYRQFEHERSGRYEAEALVERSLPPPLRRVHSDGPPALPKVTGEKIAVEGIVRQFIVEENAQKIHSEIKKCLEGLDATRFKAGPTGGGSDDFWYQDHRTAIRFCSAMQVRYPEISEFRRSFAKTFVGQIFLQWGLVSELEKPFSCPFTSEEFRTVFPSSTYHFP